MFRIEMITVNSVPDTRTKDAEPTSCDYRRRTCHRDQLDLTSSLNETTPTVMRNGKAVRSASKVEGRRESGGAF